MSETTLQEAIDCFIRHQQTHDFRQSAVADTCFDALAEYLQHHSDLFRDEEEEGPDMLHWEQDLQDHMEHLLEGDVEQTPDLGTLKCTDFAAGHLSDFIGWFMLRMQTSDESIIGDYCACLRAWLNFMNKRHWLAPGAHTEFMGTLVELEPESLRAARAAQLLLHYVRMGRGVSASLREHRFSSFREGHARITELLKKQMWLQFDGQDSCIGPVLLAKEIVSVLRPGDVLDIELGLRGDTWLIVDIGPVYPQAVYVEAEEIELAENILY